MSGSGDIGVCCGSMSRDVLRSAARGTETDDRSGFGFGEALIVEPAGTGAGSIDDGAGSGDGALAGD